MPFPSPGLQQILLTFPLCQFSISSWIVEPRGLFTFKYRPSLTANRHSMRAHLSDCPDWLLVLSSGFSPLTSCAVFPQAHICLFRLHSF